MVAAGDGKVCSGPGAPRVLAVVGGALLGGVLCGVVAKSAAMFMASSGWPLAAAWMKHKPSFMKSKASLIKYFRRSIFAAMQTMTRHKAKELLGIRTDAELARIAGRTLPAVWQWGDGPIPMTSYVRLHIKHPKLFPMPKESK